MKMVAAFILGLFLAAAEVAWASGVSVSIGSQTTAVTTDTAQSTLQNTNVTASTIWSPYGPFVEYDGYRSVMVVPNGTTATSSNAYGGYIRCDTPSINGGTQGNCVGQYLFGVANANNAAVWGSNPNLVCALGITGCKLIGAEYDLTAKNVTDVLQGPNCLGSSTAQPSYAACFVVGSPGSGIYWDLAFGTADGVVKNGGSALTIGAQNAAGANSTGQLTYYGYRNAGNTSQGVNFKASATGGFTLSNTESTPVVLTGGSIVLPTSCTGMPSGALRNNAGSVAICP